MVRWVVLKPFPFRRGGESAPLLLAILLCGFARSSTADSLDRWTPVSLQPTPNPMYSYGCRFEAVAYGNGRFVAAGQYVADDYGVVETSTDGINWSMPNLPWYGPDELFDIAYGAGVFVAAGWGGLGGYDLYYSTDGASWTTINPRLANINRVIYAGGQFVAVSDGVVTGSVVGPPWGGSTNRSILTSPDGVNWTARRCGSPSTDVHPLYDVAYGLGLYVAVDDSHNFYTSNDGAAWTRTADSHANSRINFCNDRFIVPAGAGTNYVSFNGTSWLTMNNTTGLAFGRILYAAGYYVAAAGSTICTSRDATNWTTRPVPSSAGLAFSGLTYANGRFWAPGGLVDSYTNSPALYCSGDPCELQTVGRSPPQLQLQGLQGQNYELQWREDLKTGSWATLTNFTLGATPFTCTDPQATNRLRFYRAVMLH